MIGGPGTESKRTPPGHTPLSETLNPASRHARQWLWPELLHQAVCRRALGGNGSPRRLSI